MSEMPWKGSLDIWMPKSQKVCQKEIQDVWVEETHEKWNDKRENNGRHNLVLKFIVYSFIGSIIYIFNNFHFLNRRVKVVIVK